MTSCGFSCAGGRRQELLCNNRRANAHCRVAARSVPDLPSVIVRLHVVCTYSPFVPLLVTPLEVMLMASLFDDLMLEIFRRINCTRVLLHAAQACKRWNAMAMHASVAFRHTWLSVKATTIVDVLRHAPSGARIHIPSGVKLQGQLLLPRAVHLRAEPGVTLHGKLILQETRELGIVEGLTSIISWSRP